LRGTGDSRSDCWEKRARCESIATIVGFCGVGHVYDTAKASVSCARAVCSNVSDTSACCKVSAFCSVPSITFGVQQWHGSQCNSGSTNVAEGTECRITSESGYACTDPGLCGSDGNFANAASCQRLCTVPSIFVGVLSWSGSNCGSGSTNVVEGTTCQIIAESGYACVSPGLCGSNGDFANVGACNVLASATTSAAATTTTTTLARVVEGSIKIEVTNATEFVKDPNVTNLFRIAIAGWFDVNISWVQDVRVVLKDTRRLSMLPITKGSLFAVSETILRMSRYLVATEEVDVSWHIEIPPGENTVIAHVLVDNYNQLAISEITASINTLISAGLLGDPYDVDVIWNYAWVPEPDAAEVNKPEEHESGEFMVAIIISAVSFSVMLLIIVLALIVRRRMRRGEFGKTSDKSIKKNRSFTEMAGPLLNASFEELMSPPPFISSEKAGEIGQLMQAIYECQPPPAKVFITYAVGSRSEDVEGFGPASFYVAALAKFLYDHGIPCFCDLMLDKFSDQNVKRQVFNAQLSGRFSECELLLVVVTDALYNCKDSLRDIHSAQESKFQIFPLRFEQDIPSERNPWPQVARHEMEYMLMIAAVERGFCKLNSIPSPPYTIRNQPTVMKDVLSDLKEMLGYNHMNLAFKKQSIFQLARKSTKMALDFVHPNILGNKSSRAPALHSTGVSESRPLKSCPRKAHDPEETSVSGSSFSASGSDLQSSRSLKRKKERRGSGSASGKRVTPRGRAGSDPSQNAIKQATSSRPVRNPSDSSQPLRASAERKERNRPRSKERTIEKFTSNGSGNGYSNNDSKKAKRALMVI